MEAEELRAYVLSRLKNECEECVVMLHFGDGLPPRVIAHERPDLFRTAAEVSRVVDNLRRRLRRDPYLQAYYRRRYRGQPAP